MKAEAGDQRPAIRGQKSEVEGFMDDADDDR